MKFKWVCEIELDEAWVADGFELTEDKLIAMVKNYLSFAYENEINCKILSSPPQEKIKKCQGF